MSKEEIITMFKDAAECFSNDSTYAETDSPLNKNKLHDLKSSSSISSSLFKKKKIKITCLQEEITSYLESKCEEEACEPLEYWKWNSKKFPSLSSMAQTYLAASASSTPCERAFSVGRHVQDYSRNQMKSTTLESIICLQNWIDKGVISISNSENFK
ncbi:hypothetical protein PtA15_10A249 [Puccinia triticina]|uniref:HAT C-terminal dimerisation domain-containing protein n=1 Tax=Puccinia triticina TaxID=208348 RepID=A0ABY7CU51_9BASI|nr:uncharacterized protein PtA15_10A249 [Puccinia triticina]WAQ88829.1 hypothetical protein PtA15_10A249 [Puccinia triticina]